MLVICLTALHFSHVLVNLLLLISFLLVSALIFYLVCKILSLDYWRCWLKDFLSFLLMIYLYGKLLMLVYSPVLPANW